MPKQHLLVLFLCAALFACGGDDLTQDELQTLQQSVSVARGPNANDCRQDLARSRWVACGDDGLLRYAPDASTKAILLDYSRVGYHDGDDPLPTFTLRQSVAPSGKDDTEHLQAAINAVGALSPDAQGVRGRVKLAPGVFRINRPLLFSKSGVSLEGTASVGRLATTIQVLGSATSALHVSGPANAKVTTKAYPVAKLPVPAGSQQLTLASAQGLAVGDQVRVTSTRNLAWIKKKWGGVYPPKRDGKDQPAWGDHMVLQVPRTIVAVAGNTVTFDVPLPDAIPVAAEADKGGAYLQKLDTSSYLREVGIAHLRLAGRFVSGDITNGKLLVGIVFANAEDCWVDDVEATDFGSGTVDLDNWTRHITLQDVRTVRTGIQDGAAKPFDLSISGQLHLVQGCASNGNKTFYVASQTISSAGPNVVQNYRAAGMGTFEPHQRWSTGILYDNVYAPDAGIALIDRGTAGSGHGWAMGFGAVYNSLAGTGNKQKAGMNSSPGLTVNQPPAATNWAIGLVGPNHSANDKDTHYDSAQRPVSPASLWAYQLWSRRGDEGLANVMGPWHLRELRTDKCVSVDQAKAGALLVLRDCSSKKQLALWDVTSRGNIRLGGTGLCVDADSDRRNTLAKLAVCDSDDEQRWAIGTRGGKPTQVRLRKPTGDQAACLAVDGVSVVVGACQGQIGSWRLVPTYLAR